jgi:hypothetical protein
MRLSPSLNPSGLTEQRRSRRLKVFLRTEVIIDDVAIRAHVLDLSSLGSLLHTGTEPALGCDASLRLNGEAWSAKVVWVSGGRLGLEFGTKIPTDQIATIIIS